MLNYVKPKSETNENDLQIVLVKPGATDFDDQGRIVGSLDVPLSDVGMLQAREAADALADVDLTAVYSGPCLAAQQTAVEITAHSRVRPRVEPLLKNIDMGLWQGREMDELKANQPRFVRQWQDNPDQVCPPEGETLMDVRPRVDALLKRISRKHKNGVVVIVVADPLASVIASRIDMFESPSDAETVVEIRVKQFEEDRQVDSSRKEDTDFGCLQKFQLGPGFII